MRRPFRIRSRLLARALAAALVLLVAALVGGDLEGALDDLGGGSVERQTGGGLAVSPGQRLSARVVRVVDGDTAVVEIEGREERLRYIGVDTPESVKPGSPVECFAKRAAARNTELVEGRRVELELDREVSDRYGRLLAYVRRGDLFVNAELLRGGYARTLTIAPNDRYAGQFARLEETARSAGAGLWGSCG